MRYNKLMSIFLQAIVWQFCDVPRAILKGWGNFLNFNLNYFSLPLLLKTFFSPWRRYRYFYGRTFEVWHNIEVFVFNMMSRIIGALLRICLIILGLAVELLIFFIGLIVFLAWLVLPLFLIFALIFGLELVFGI